MEQLMFKVSFSIKTSQYKSVSSDFQAAVLALSYDDAANSVKSIYGKYKDFKLGEITPVGIPEENTPRVEKQTVNYQIDIK